MRYNSITAALFAANPVIKANTRMRNASFNDMKLINPLKISAAPNGSWKEPIFAMNSFMSSFCFVTILPVNQKEPNKITVENNPSKSARLPMPKSLNKPDIIPSPE